MSAESILDLMASDADQKAMELPSSEKVTDLSKLVADLDRETAKLVRMQEAVKEQTRIVKNLNEQEIPELFKTMGSLKSLELDDGRKVSVVEDFAISIKKATQESAFQWLRENGKEEIIKRSFTLKFDRGESERADKAALLLLESDLSFSDTETVHAQTLKASMRGMIEKGITPPDEFTYYPYKKTVIK